MSITAACITFPGSNCDQDMHRAIELMGWKLVPLWHEDLLGNQVDIIFVPGGFSYGDYLRCGALARYSRAMNSVREHAARGGMVVGVCNGFQILCEAGLLPGALVRNSGLKFRCLWTHLRTEDGNSPFTTERPESRVVRVPIAHGEGNYTIDADGLKRLNDNGQVAFRYCNAEGALTAEANPNGSTDNIAGVTNEQGNVLGMMPHPERAMEDLLGGSDGRYLFASIGAALSRAGA